MSACSISDCEVMMPWLGERAQLGEPDYLTPVITSAVLAGGGILATDGASLSLDDVRIASCKAVRPCHLVPCLSPYGACVPPMSCCWRICRTLLSTMCGVTLVAAPLPTATFIAERDEQCNSIRLRGRIGRSQQTCEPCP